MIRGEIEKVSMGREKKERKKKGITFDRPGEFDPGEREAVGLS